MSASDSKLEEARNLVNEKQYDKAEQVYLSLLDKDSSLVSAPTASVDDKRRNEQETSILELGQLYVTMGAKDKLREFIPHSTEYMMQFAKSKTVKVLKTLIERFEQVPDSLDDQIFVCEKSIEFAKREKRVFLKHSLSVKLASCTTKRNSIRTH